MNERAQHDLEDPAWQQWAQRACPAVGVDPALVDIPAIHDLTRHIAHQVQRPLAPVAAFILGLAVAQAAAEGQPSRDALIAALKQVS